MGDGAFAVVNMVGEYCGMLCTGVRDVRSPASGSEEMSHLECQWLLRGKTSGLSLFQL